MERRPYTPEERLIIIDLHSKGKHKNYIAKVVNRTPKAVESELKRIRNRTNENCKILTHIFVSNSKNGIIVKRFKRDCVVKEAQIDVFELGKKDEPILKFPKNCLEGYYWPDENYATVHSLCETTEEEKTIYKLLKALEKIFKKRMEKYQEIVLNNEKKLQSVNQYIQKNFKISRI
jgi:IS30 family transposase